MCVLSLEDTKYASVFQTSTHAVVHAKGTTGMATTL